MADSCQNRTCAPPARPRFRIADLAPGMLAGPVESALYRCPGCGRVAVWVRRELHCLVCDRVHVPERTFWARLKPGNPARDRTLPMVFSKRCDALEQVRRGAKIRARWLV